MNGDASAARRGNASFLLAQLGAHAASRFSERIATLELTPPQAGLLRAVAGEPGRSQQALAEQLGMPASRLVSLVDGLQERGLVERRRNSGDRRLYAVHLTDAGAAMLRRIARAAAAHDDAVLEPLDPAERAALGDMLARLADHAGLTPGVHPGFRTVGTSPARARRTSSTQPSKRAPREGGRSAVR